MRAGFWILNILGILFGAACGAVSIYYFKDNSPLSDWIVKNIDDIFLYVMMGAASFIQILLFVFSYLASFNKNASRRPKKILYIVPLGICLLGGGFFAGILSEGNIAEKPTIIAAAAGIVIVVPFFIFIIEAFLRGFFTNFGLIFFKYKFKNLSLYFINKGLAFSPQNIDLKDKKTRLLLNKGDHDEAFALFDEIAAVEEPSVDLLKAAIAPFSANRQYDKSIYCLRKLLAIFPDEQNLQKLLSECLIKTEEIEEAVSILEKIGNYEDADFLNKMITLYLRINRIDDAIDICKRFSKMEGKPYNETIAMIKHILKKDPKNLSVMYELISFEKEINDVESLSEHLEQIVSDFPKNIEARNELVKIYKNTMQYYKLSQHLEYLLKMKEQDKDIMCDYAEALINLKQIDEAVATLTIGKSLYPDDYRFPYNLSQIYFDKNRFKQAIEEVGIALKIAPQKMMNGISILKNRIYEKYKDIKLSELKKMCEENPNSVDAVTVYADSLVQHDMIQRAAAELDGFLSVNPDKKRDIMNFLEDLTKNIDQNYLLLNYLADLYFNLGDYQKTLEHYFTLSKQSHNPKALLKDICGKIISVSPSFPEAHKILSELAESEGNLESVAEHLEIYVSSFAEPDAILLQKLLNLFYGLGDTDKSYKYCQMLIAINPEDLINLKKMILLYKEKGELESAMELAANLKKQYPDDSEIHELERETDKAVKFRRMEEIKKITAEKGDDSVLFEEYGDLAYFFDKLNDAILYYQKSAKCDSKREFPKAKLALALANKKMFELAAETLSEIKLSLSTSLPHEQFALLLGIYYSVAHLFELDGRREEAVRFYKEIFRIDAGYKNVVEKIEKLSY